MYCNTLLSIKNATVSASGGFRTSHSHSLPFTRTLPADLSPWHSHDWRRRKLSHNKALCCRLTRDDLQNAADDVDVVRLDTDEEKKQKSTEDDDEYWDADEDGRSAKSRRHDTVKVPQVSIADTEWPEVDELAQLVESEVAYPRTVKSVSNPLRLHEHNEVEDQEAQSQQSPAQSEAVSTASVCFHRFTRRHWLFSWCGLKKQQTHSCGLSWNSVGQNLQITCGISRLSYLLLTVITALFFISTTISTAPYFCFVI